MGKLTRRDAVFLAALFAAGVFLFGFNLGGYGLLDPDEPFYALSAREMLAGGDWLVPRLFGLPQFEKPVFFYWVLCASFRALGVSEFAARVGPALAALATVGVTYFWGRTVFGRRRPAFLAAAVLATSAEFIVISRIAFTDMWLCLFVTAAFFSFSAGLEEPSRRPAAWTLFFLFAGLGFLTKGPLGLVLPLAGVLSYLWFSGRGGLVREFPWKRGLLVFALTALPWYAAMAASHPTFLGDFFVHENLRRFFVAEHKSMDRPYFYPLGLALGLFPWTAFLPAALFFAVRRARKPAGGRFFFLLAAFAAPFFLLSLAKSKLLSYIFPVFPPAALLTGGWMDAAARSLSRGAAPRKPLLWTAAFVWGVFPPALVGGALAWCAKERLAIAAPLWAVGFTFVPLSWAALAFLAARRPRAAFAAAAAGVFAFAGIGFGFLLPAADSFLSSRSAGLACRRLAVPDGSFLLGGKMYVRGFAYYAPPGPVGVVAEFPEKTFFTKHPLPFFSKPGDLASVPTSAFPVYGLLRPKELSLLKGIAGPGYAVEVLETCGPRNLVRVTKGGA
ncbi:MAG TPA: glycosyltransferase family 39 protein [Candidatus Eisenbacteria bacterium]|nr:glycosyltransferase family 39 protein [Candidatus Eisenbacteria bacterium]